ncbi:regulatory protein RecX [Paraneptunicella aestuarii]|uniref:regulatory protein RecX n=1 Tax=Paraneptunicella aestuarii TaxID=2831148 RepID=UPI001E65B78E|nr:regulatory protein RecX [Paraneptunicella aestuarii]UAA37940.1 regulatory protein RecX [Paraneptunicella aestuarii]
MDIDDFDSSYIETSGETDTDNSTEFNEDEIRRQIQFTITRYLAQREHGFNEIIRKLQQKGYPKDLCLEVLAKYQESELQSDRRFAEQLVHRRLSKGYGENYILAEGQHKGISNSVLQLVLEELDVDWQEQAREAAESKFGDSKPRDAKEHAKRCNFLRNRGFNAHEVFGVYPFNDFDG